MIINFTLDTNNEKDNKAYILLAYFLKGLSEGEENDEKTQVLPLPETSENKESKKTDGGEVVVSEGSDETEPTKNEDLPIEPTKRTRRSKVAKEQVAKSIPEEEVKEQPEEEVKEQPEDEKPVEEQPVEDKPDEDKPDEDKPDEERTEDEAKDSLEKTKEFAAAIRKFRDSMPKELFIEKFQSFRKDKGIITVGIPEKYQEECLEYFRNL